MIIDPTSNIGKLRLRCGDYNEIGIMPDSVYQSVLDDNENNLNASARVMAMYILGALSKDSHRKLVQIEVWGKEAFDSYKEFLMLTFKDPAFMNLAPIPYSGGLTEDHPLIQFATDWNNNHVRLTDSEQLNLLGQYRYIGNCDDEIL